MSAAFTYSAKGWLGKASAGVILGFTLALGFTGLFVWLTPDGLMAGSGKTQFAMWLVAPIWCGIASFCFLFRSGIRAWLWLGGANIVVFALLAIAKSVG
ncbi:hypothetical protein [Qipengyuania nanhaisediminis]|uniref:Uncharacterized protein n=1 Tax=Qipengyuania nanhaisediminis TaxID=604088 RepID=A0A1I5NYR3_9SPHN|nr:hypothetical protein [Qipengyuania nanhaisediminis]SFP26968.1 hypothetical protein SAMN04488060_2194 [Qipengyuania nanhaisediminis]